MELLHSGGNEMLIFLLFTFKDSHFTWNRTTNILLKQLKINSKSSITFLINVDTFGLIFALIQ